MSRQDREGPPPAPALDGPGLYLHLPFCSAICPYCDFSVTTGGAARRRRFVDTLIAEIALAAADPWRRRDNRDAETPGTPFDTVYLGGGTPSWFEPEELDRLLAALRRQLPVRADAWVLLEANPEDVDRRRLEAWRWLGVRTLSLGVQSFDAGQLAFLGRRHDPATARRAVELALGADFATVSVDLIYALPGQEPGGWRRQLMQAVRLGAQHLSCYQLTVHSRTPFGVKRRRGELTEADEETQAELLLLTHRFLADRGFAGYEVSNFAAAAEHRSPQNLKYWRHVPYLGLGPSAHSFDGRRRWWNHRRPAPWSAAVEARRRPLAGDETLTPGELTLEAIALGLRTTDGVDFDSLPVGGTALWEHNQKLVQRLIAAGMARTTGRRLRPTLRGLAVADALARSFDLSPLTASRPAAAAG